MTYADRQRLIADRFFKHLQDGTTDMHELNLRIPASEYVDQQQTTREVDHCFRRSPTLVALSPDLPEQGSYVTNETVGTSLLLVRNSENTVRAFVNACRHRGSRIAEGRGIRKSFSCPYHAWNWSTDGQIISRPNSCGGFDTIDESYDSLHEIQCCEISGMVFVLLEGEADIRPQVIELLGDALTDIDDFNIQDTAYIGERITERDCNYKLLLDGFCEAYHLDSLHKKTLAPLVYTKAALIDRISRTVRSIGVRKTIEEDDKAAAERRLQPHGTMQYLIAPNAVLQELAGGVHLWRICPVDGAVDRCRVELTHYCRAPMDDEAKENAQLAIDRVWMITTTEDFPQSLLIHKNLASGALPELVFGRNEPGLIHYHSLMRETIGLDLDLDLIDGGTSAS